jgi:hypothetical protein
MALAALTGCGFSGSAIAVESIQPPTAIHGSVYGGQQPISGSSVQLYAAGANGVGSAAIPLLSQPAQSDGKGNFSIPASYLCPSASSQVYLIARGGNPGLASGADNPALSLMTMLGSCNSLSSIAHVSVNEVTTVGSIWPLASYMKSPTDLGSAPGDGAFLAAASSVNEFINIAQGSSPGTPTPESYFGEGSKLYSLADVLDKCVNSAGGTAGDGGPCGDLFSMATLSGGSAPSDTASAAMRIAQRPFNEVATIYGLAASPTAFLPALTAAPPDWTLTLTYPAATPPAPPVATPAISLASGTYIGSQQVTISDATGGSEIYYTTDGTAPTTSSALYSAAISIEVSTTLRAIAVVGQSQSAVASSTLTITAAPPASVPVATPTISLGTGTYVGNQEVTITDPTAGSRIHYTLDGTVPTPSSPLYTGAISIAVSTTVRAIAAVGQSQSAVASSTITIVAPAGGTVFVATPAISLGTGTYIGSQELTIVDSTLDSTIHYTTDGTVPTTSSPIYSGGILIAVSTKVQAIAVVGQSESAVASSTITITAPASPSTEPAQLAFVQQPSNASAQATISPAVTVRVLDQNGVLVNTATNTISVSLGGAAAAGSLNGTLSRSAVNGVATFNDLSVSSAGQYTLKAISSGLSAAISTSFSISSAPTAPPPQTGEQAVSALSFTDTVGINIHLTFDNTIYKTNFPLVLSSLQDLGIRHVRDGLVEYGTGSSFYYTEHQQLAANGIRADFISSINQPEALLKAYPARVGDMEALEAPNEYDASGDPQWAKTLGAYLPILHHAVHGSQPMSGVTLFGPSLVDQNWSASNNSYAQLGADSSLFDYGNLHNYQAGRNPGTPGWTPQGYGSIAFAISSARQEWPTVPIVTTEKGYVDNPALTDWIPDVPYAKYVPRVLLEQYLHGIVRTYIYSLADTYLPGDSYGLLREDGSQKPAYVSLQSMMHLLADPGASYIAGKLSWTMSGGASDLHHLLLQKRDGTFLLALWVEEPCYDVNSQTYLTVPAQNVSLAFSNAVTIESINTLQTNGSMTSTAGASAQKTSLPLSITDALTIVELHQ